MSTCASHFLCLWLKDGARLEKGKEQQGVSLYSWDTAPLVTEKGPHAKTYRCFPLPPPTMQGCLRACMGKQMKTKVEFLLFSLTGRVPLPTLRSRNRGLLLERFVPAPGFQSSILWATFESRPGGTGGKKDPRIACMVQWSSEFWFPSPNLLPFTFLNPHKAAPVISPRVFSCVQREKQDEECFLHLDWTRIFPM